MVYSKATFLIGNMGNVKNIDKKLFSRKKRFIDVISNRFFSVHKGVLQSWMNACYQSKMKSIALEMNYERQINIYTAREYFNILDNIFKESKNAR